MRHLPRAELASLFSAGDLVIANDAATLPASLHGTHCASGEPIEVRLAAWEPSAIRPGLLQWRSGQAIIARARKTDRLLRHSPG